MDDKLVSIELKISQWNVVMNALVGRPYGEVAQIIADVQRQASEQAPATPAPAQE